MFLMDMFAKEYWELPGNGMIHKDIIFHLFFKKNND